MKAENFLVRMGYRKRKVRGKEEWKFTKDSVSEEGKIIVEFVFTSEHSEYWYATCYTRYWMKMFANERSSFPLLLVSTCEKSSENLKASPSNLDLTLAHMEFQALLLKSINVH